jgi:DNA-binding CsgD family transcriptional regulator
MDRLDAEHANLRAAVRWAVDRQEVELGLRLILALGQFRGFRGRSSEAREPLTRLLALPSTGTKPRLRAAALRAVGNMALSLGDFAEARSFLDESLRVARAAEDALSAGHALSILCRLAYVQGDWAAGRTFGEQSVAIFRELQEPWFLGMALYFLGLATTDPEQARTHFEESLALVRAVGDGWELGSPLRGLGLVAYQMGDYALGGHLLEDALACHRDNADAWSVPVVLHDLGYVALEQGDLRRAAALFAECLVLTERLGNAPRCGLILVGLAGVAIREGQAVRAARLFGAAEAVRDASGIALEVTDRGTYDHHVAITRRALGADLFAAAWAQGRAMPLEQAIAYALAGERLSPVEAHYPGAATDAACPDQLTRREREVLALLARGLTNRQIAAELVITEGTAALHVKHILHKLGFSSRTQAAAWIVQQRLTTTPASSNA